MRFTKVLREYVTEELNKKRIEANESDELAIIYKEKRKAAIGEINELLKEVNTTVAEILDKYELENLQEKNYGREIVSFYDGYIGNADMYQEIRKRETERYNKQKKAIQEIEVNCTLGANREEFMKMISEVKF